MGGGSSSSKLPDDFAFETLNDAVVEHVVEVDETRAFDADEAICLFRLREKKLATNRKGETEKDLYRGMVVHMFSKTHQDAFRAWAGGKVGSMKEALK